VTEASPLLVRRARDEDLAAMAEVTAEAYHRVDLLTQPRSWPDPVRRPTARQGAWIARTRGALETDPEGCFVAEADGEVVGCAVSRTRELMWILSSFAVSPTHQGLGVGTQLLQAALHHGRGCLRGMFASSADPAAVRAYRRAGFDLHPQMVLRGVVDRSDLPVVERVREGSAGDRDLMDSVDRQTRGAAHGPDHDVLLAQLRLVVTDHHSGSGYAYLDPDTGAPLLLAATSRRTASALMWEGLASSPPGSEVVVAHVTAANQWALDVGLEARLEVHQSGYLALRHMAPPSPYVHHGSLL
jgi:ribosomal protein S18 acetylase RimI-like enzyme